MNNILLLNKETYEILYDKPLQKQSMFNSKEFNQNLFQNAIETIKDLDQMDLNSDYYALKVENNKTIIYRKSKSTKLAILITVDKKSFYRNNLIQLSDIYLKNSEKNVNDNLINNNFKKNNNLFQTREFTIDAIEQLTINFIENLRKNKLYAKFIYYNFNPIVTNSICYKKSKLESTSVILFNSNKDYDKMYNNY